MGAMNNKPDPTPFPSHRRRPPHYGLSLWYAWSTIRILGLTFMLVLGDFLIQIVFYALGGGLFLPVLLGTVGGVLVPLWLMARSFALPWRHDFSVRWPHPVILAGSGLMAVAALAPTSLLAQLSLRLHPADPTWTALMADNIPTGPGAIALAIVTVVIAAPLAEELVFRGLVYRLARRLWGPWAAAVASALIFGLVHGQPWYLFGLVGIGAVLAVVYEATGSVLACWVTHMVHNGISLVMMIASHRATDDLTPLTLTDWLLAAGSLVVLILLGIYLLQNGRPRGAR